MNISSSSSRSLPERVILREDGPREGFQMHAEFVPTDLKVEFINRLSTTGIRSIETTSFVRPDLVPQLADAETVAAQLKITPGVRYRALYLNEKGLRRALLCPQLKPEGSMMIAASEKFLKTNNNMTIDETIETSIRWLEIFRETNLTLERIMFSTAFGDSHEGTIDASRVIAICGRLLQTLSSAGETPEEMTFADTTGWANPEAVRRLVGEFQSRWPEIHVGLHLHDTRGTGMANVYAGLEAGVSRFDCSVGGLGGCPSVPGAAGNVPTEDVAFLCEELGIQTGLNLEAYIDCANFAASLVKHPLPGKLHRGGLLKKNESTRAP